MKKILIIMMITATSACGILQKSFYEAEEELFISRKYIGDFIEYRYVVPENYAGPHIIWIKTTMESAYGKISAYGKRCDFKPGERIYLRRTVYDPGISSGFWVYHVENDSLVIYEATEFQHQRKYETEKIFQAGFTSEK